MLQRLLLANSHVSTELVDSESSPKGFVVVDAAVMRALEPLGMTMYIHTHRYTTMAFQSAFRQI